MGIIITIAVVLLVVGFWSKIKAFFVKEKDVLEQDVEGTTPSTTESEVLSKAPLSPAPTPEATDFAVSKAPLTAETGSI